MSFLFPILLGGLALAAVPVVLHLIMRRKPKSLPFPAFRFLVQTRKRNLRKLRLRQLLLLALRVLIIAAVVAAVAQPKIFNNTLQLSTQRPTAVVLLFDTSPSMDYRSAENQSRLDEAKRLGHELLDQLTPASRVVVLDTAEARDLGDKAWQSPDEARKAIDQLKVRPANAPVTAWLKPAYALFEKTSRHTDPDVRRMPRLLCVFSDCTTASWDKQEMTRLQESREGVPPGLDQLQRMHGKLPGVVELLESLGQQLPPTSEQNYGGRTLVDRLGALRERVQGYTQEDYPDDRIRDLVADVRREARRLVEQLQTREAQGEALAYRDKLLGELRALLRDLRGVREIYFDVGDKTAVDRAVVDVRFPENSRGERLLFGADEQFTLRVVVQYTGAKGEKAQAMPLKCLVGEKGAEELKRQVDAKRAKGRDEQDEQEDEEEARAKLVLSRPGLALEPGQSETVEFVIDCKKLGPGLHQLRVHLGRPDSNATNDQRFATFAVQQLRPILLIADSAADAADWKEAIEARQEALLTCDVKLPADVVAGGAKGLAPYRTVFLCHVARPPAELWQLLAGYVAGGRSVGVLLGEELSGADYASDEAKKLLPAVPRAAVKVKDALSWDWDDDAIFKHPLLSPIGVWRKNGQVDFLQEPRLAARYWEVQPAPGARTVAAFAARGKPPALLERQPDGKGGRVLLLTTPASNRLGWNNYMDSLTTFGVVLPGLWVKYFVGDPEEVRFNFTVRGRLARTPQLPVVPQPPAAGAQLHGDLLAVQPGGGKARPRPTLSRGQPVGNKIFPDTSGKAERALPEATQPGNYRLDNGVRFSVNTPPEECDLSHVPLSDIEALFGIDSVVPVGQDRRLADVIREEWGEPLELFPYLMILLLFLVAVENLLANRFYRREPQTTT
jgi:hypothetical protein